MTNAIPRATLAPSVADATVTETSGKFTISQSAALPHAVTVEVEEMDEKVVRANVFVETESQKQILVGKQGAMIKQIGTRARPEIEALLGNKVFLELHVKVRPKWRRDENMLERLGI